jgi:hypothetical protein
MIQRVVGSIKNNVPAIALSGMLMSNIIILFRFCALEREHAGNNDCEAHLDIEFA